jgi:hypothetical protein
MDNPMLADNWSGRPIAVTVLGFDGHGGEAFFRHLHRRRRHERLAARYGGAKGDLRRSGSITRQAMAKRVLWQRSRAGGGKSAR